MPLAFDGKHLKKLIDHHCTAERLDSWVQSSTVVHILKDWVKVTLQCREHEDVYRALLLPEESDKKWSDFEKDCVHLTCTRIKGEDSGEPASNDVTEAWSQAIEQLVRDSWKDAVCGPLNGGQKPGYFNDWSCERACYLLRTIYEDLRKEPDNGCFANLLGAFTGQRYLLLPPEAQPSDTAPKPACETCRFNHVAYDRAQPVRGQCKHPKVLCTKTSDVVPDSAGDTTDGEPLLKATPKLLLPLPLPLPKPMQKPMQKPMPEPILDLFSGLGPHNPVTTLQSYEPNTLACKTCRLKHQSCDRVGPICSECSSRGVECIWDRPDITETIKPAGKPETDIVLLDGEIDENRKVTKFPAVNTPPQQPSPKRASSGKSDAPTAKRPHLMDAPAPFGCFERSGVRPQSPNLESQGGKAGTTVQRASIAPMMGPLNMSSIPSFGMVHSDRLARIEQPSSPAPLATHPADNIRPRKRMKNKKNKQQQQHGITGSNRVEVSTTRAIKIESDEVLNVSGPSHPRSVSGPFLAQLSNGLQGGQLTTRPQTNCAGDLFPADRPNPNTTPAASRTSPSDGRPNEEARLSSSLQYCKTLFEDILAGRNSVNAAKMGVTAIQHALGKD